MMLSSLENKIKYFLLGLIFVYNIRFIGAINSGEIISSIYVLFNLRKISLSNELKILIKVSLFYVLLIAISDIYNSNSLYNSLKGAFTPIVILVTIIFLINFFTNKRKKSNNKFFKKTLCMLKIKNLLRLNFYNNLYIA